MASNKHKIGSSLILPPNQRQAQQTTVEHRMGATIAVISGIARLASLEMKKANLYSGIWGVMSDAENEEYTRLKAWHNDLGDAKRERIYLLMKDMAVGCENLSELV